jgi:hypothetical protein
MYKLKRKTPQKKTPTLYNIIEDYTEFDPPGNVTLCATTEPEDIPEHARILAESYEVPVETMVTLLADGGVYLYPQTGLLVTQGLFTCRRGPAAGMPKQTWVLDVVQYAEAEQLVRSYGVPLEEASARVFYRTLPPDLRERMDQKNLGLDPSRLDRTVARHGDIKYIDFRKDWSPHFKRLCIMPDGRLVETGGIADFATLHGITVADARRLIEHGGTLDTQGGEVLACQIVNGQPAVARFNRAQYAKAKQIAVDRKLHVMDALSDVALNDPQMMNGLKRLERRM